MICPRCGNRIPQNRNYCDKCNADLTTYKKIIYLSNRYYNIGLERAGVRDLTGAVQYLKRSLEINKKNIDARNLLGLVYFEMGEVVAAIGEWVVSTHFAEENNQANVYMELIQSNPTKLDAMNQAIKKYNIALDAANQGGDDLAILQLKKVVSLYPNFIRARLLLSLLYLHTGEKEKAKKQLNRVLAIDAANTTALRFMAEITEPKKDEAQDSDESDIPDNIKFTKQVSYAEDKPNVMAWVALIVGALLGVLVTFFLVVPTAKKNIQAEFDKNQLNYSSELRIKEASITALEKETEMWQSKYEEAKLELSKVVIPEDKTPAYDDFFAILREFTRLNAEDEPDINSLAMLSNRMTRFPESVLENADAKALFEDMKQVVNAKLAKPSYDLGRAAYQEEHYEQAIPYLQTAYDSGYREDRCYYYLAKCYQMTNKYEQAAFYFKELIAEYPGSELAGYARTRLQDMGYSEN